MECVRAGNVLEMHQVKLNSDTRMCSVCIDYPSGGNLPACYLIYDQSDAVNLYRSGHVILISNLSEMSKIYLIYDLSITESFVTSRLNIQQNYSQGNSLFACSECGLDLLSP